MQGLYNGFGLQTMTKHAAHGNDPAFWGNQVQENFRTYELRGNFQIGNRLKTYVIIPFVQNSQYIDKEERFTVSGFGDPILIQGFQLIDPTRISKFENITQRMEMGFGVKFPLGKIDKWIDNTRPNLDLQAGTGSWDLLTYAKYTLMVRKAGLILNTNYKWNTANKEAYKYGNVVNGTLNFFYQTELKQLTFIPMVGLNVEYAQCDFSTEVHLDTGGKAFFAGGGLQMFWKGIKLFGEFQKAVSNKMNGYTQLINKHKINIGLSYYF